MDNQHDWKQLPFSLEEELGPIESTEQPCPGVYYLAVKEEEELLAREYYVVMDTSVISQEVRAYGSKICGLRLFPVAEDKSGWRIVEYEAAKYRVKNHLPQEKSLHDIALYAAEYHPEYFGAYPVPICTSRGYTVRYWILENGIYWIETDRSEEVLAVCYPIWSAELPELAEHFGEQAEHDKTCGIHQTLGYIFFSREMSCTPICELMQTRPAWEGRTISKPALMNAIWKHIPEYAVLVNHREQSGLNDLTAMLLRDLGIAKAPHTLQDRMIYINQNVGEDYLMFKNWTTQNLGRD